MLYSFGASFLLLILLTITFTNICKTMTSTQTNTKQVEQISYYPFYSNMAVSGAFLFSVIFTYMSVKDLIQYFRYGVFNPNSFYSA